MSWTPGASSSRDRLLCDASAPLIFVSYISMQDEAGQIIGAEVRDELAGKPIPVHARVVINAGGPFSDSIRQMADENVRSA